jgi:hypothetical protein
VEAQVRFVFDPHASQLKAHAFASGLVGGWRTPPHHPSERFKNFQVSGAPPVRRTPT